MEGVIFMLIVALVMAVLAGPGLAIVALIRLRALGRQERRIATLEAAVRRLGQSVSAAQPSPPAASPATPPASSRVPFTAEQRPTAAPAPSKRRPVTPSAPPPQRKKTNWEHWIGIRGAALVGAIALALAGLLLFEYSIEHGLISPTMRVLLGSFTGMTSLGFSHWLRGRGYRHPAAGLAGAGVVLLYAAIWAAHALYGLIGMLPGFLLMAGVTAICCVIATRSSSLLVATIGLIGGFATPLLLADGVDRPIGLFGYVLLLDVGLLWLGLKRGWPSLGLSSLGGTLLLETVWIGNHMGPDRLMIGLVVLALFALLFTAAGSLARGSSAHGTWLANQAAAIAFPFAFAIYFAGRAGLSPHLLPIGLLLGLLSAAAGWLARRHERREISLSAAVASVAVVGVWSFQHHSSVGSAWELAVVAVGLSLIFHLHLETDREPLHRDAASVALVGLTGFTLVLTTAWIGSPASPWPWICGFTALTLLAYRQSSFPGMHQLRIAALAVFGLCLSLIHFVGHGRPDFLTRPAMSLILLGASLAAYGARFVCGSGQGRAWSDRATAALSVVLLGGLAVSPFASAMAPQAVLGIGIVLAGVGVLAAADIRDGRWYAAIAAAFVLQIWGTTGFAEWERIPSVALTALLFGLGAVALLTHAQFFRGAFLESRVALYAAALVGPLSFTPLRHLWLAAFGDGFIVVLPLLLGVVSLTAVVRSLGSWTAGTERVRALAWHSAVSLGFLTVASTASGSPSAGRSRGSP